ncbi:MAG: OstA-like protein [Ferruginibacter sp.]|nr:OstA-like protein [Ferruginibacter sp.]
MKSKFTLSYSIGLLLSFFTSISQAQVAPPPSSAPDTLRVIQIIQGQRLREKTLDSATSLQTIAGKVILKEGLTTFYCDSAVINKRTNIVEAYGNIHINQNDSIHTYSQFLRYIGNERMAYLKKDVRLTDNKGTLFTQDLEYDLKSSIGKYKSGGRVVNGKTVLTSTEGIYYADTKDVHFKKNVHLVDPKYDFRNDTMLYNTQTQVSSWTTPTVIKSKNGGDIYSSNGTYDLKNGQAFFGNRTVIKDSTRTYVADNSAYDEKTGIAQLEGNAVIKDSVNGYSVLGGQIYLNKNDNSFLATRKPILIFKGEAADSTFIAADTLFSGVEKVDKDGKRIVVKKDTLKKETVISLKDSAVVIRDIKDDTVKTRKPFQGDSVRNKMLAARNALPNLKDSIASAMKTNKTDTSLTSPLAAIGDSLVVRKVMMDSLSGLTGRSDSLLVRDTSAKKAARDPADTTIRYFIAFHNVRIFNDSLQSVCDSLYYTSEDSIFRLFKDPLVFSNNSQIAGDTIYLFTKNKKAERVYVFENGIVINKANEKMFNQVGGRTINGYFVDGQIDYVRAKGSPAESVFYPQDDDSAYIGMNRSKGDLIDVYFLDKAIHRVKFFNDVDGTLYPMRQIPEDQKYLRNYEWLDKRRPKSKFELFE